MTKEISDEFDQLNSETLTEIVSNFQNMSNRMTTFNDRIWIEHEERLNQLATKDIIITECYKDIETCKNLLDDCKSALKKHKCPLEVKWDKVTNQINEYDKKRANQNNMELLVMMNKLIKQRKLIIKFNKGWTRLSDLYTYLKTWIINEALHSLI